jgi:hypothetical protein
VGSIGVLQRHVKAIMIMRGLGRWLRPSPEVKSASLSRAADFYLDRKPVVHESHDKDHKQIPLSASLGIARGPTPGFPFEALVLHLETRLIPTPQKAITAGAQMAGKLSGAC